MRFKYFLFIALIVLTGCTKKGTTDKITFGTLPVIQALPIFVANDLDLFQKHGVEVSIVPFNSALESEIAITAKQIDGYFADIITPIILKANNTNLQIVSTLFKTDETQRMFALLAPPNDALATIKSIAENGVAVSANTVIDYITPYLLQSIDSDVFEYNKIDTKKIPIRLQLLLQGQVPAAVLPEPLASFAEQRGAVIIADDRELAMAPTVAVFSSEYLKRNQINVERFLLAIGEAITIINDEPSSVRNIMLNNCSVPDLLKDTFPVPHFPKLSLPSKRNLIDAQNWLLKNDIINTSIEVEDLITDDYLL